MGMGTEVVTPIRKEKTVTAVESIWDRLHAKVPEPTEPPRDYGKDIKEAIERAIPNLGTYTSRGVAHEIVAYLREHDPELLAGWLDSRADHFLAMEINIHDVKSRSRMRTTARSVFADAAKLHDQGNPVPLMMSLMNAPYVVSRDGTRKKLAAMTAEDLNFAAAAYGGRAKRNAFEATFLKALARKIGDGIVGDYFTELQLAEMRESLTI